MTFKSVDLFSRRHEAGDIVMNDGPVHAQDVINTMTFWACAAINTDLQIIIKINIRDPIQKGCRETSFSFSNRDAVVAIGVANGKKF